MFVADIQAKAGEGFEASKDRLITIYFETELRCPSKDNDSDRMRDTTQAKTIRTGTY